MPRSGLRSRLLLPALLFLVALLAWDTPALWPLKVLVVLFHELSHAAAALLTGGRVLALDIGPDQGGMAVTAGGSPLVILNAGYLGSLLWGVALLAAARRPTPAVRAAQALAGVLCVAAVLWLRPLLGFAFLFATATALTMVLLTRLAPPRAVQALLRGLGAFSVLYALLDIRHDVWLVDPDVPSDAALLAAHTGIPAVFWGVLWLSLGAWTLFALRRWLL